MSAARLEECALTCLDHSVSNVAQVQSFAFDRCERALLRLVCSTLHQKSA